MNNEDSSKMDEWRWRISTRVRERAHSGPGHDGEMGECNLLVLPHQLEHRGDMKRMEADTSWTKGQGWGVAGP